jgi:CRP/FNR family cyclic AMP-dependent transcriptional regulator
MPGDHAGRHLSRARSGNQRNIRLSTQRGEAMSVRGAPVSVLQRVPLFADLSRHEVGQIARLFKERRFAAGETVIQEGSGGAAFFIIDAGEARVLIHGREHSTLKAEDYFGEIAMIDQGPRMATIVACSELVCYGLTYWDFRPLVEANGVIGWKLLERMAKMLREAEAEQN